MSYWKNLVGTERVRIIHGKRAIRVRAIEVILNSSFKITQNGLLVRRTKRHKLHQKEVPGDGFNHTHTQPTLNTSCSDDKYKYV